jgi:hypothetical protein
LKIIAVGLFATIALWGAGCSRQPPPPAASAPAAAVEEHGHHAPHGGVLVGLEDDFGQVELALDSASGTLTAYMLDGEAEESVRLKQPSLTVVIDAPAPGSGAAQTLELAARADILTGETVGDSSEFSATSPSLRGAGSLKGTILDITVKGREFRNLRF